ncbi:MAG: ABC transporter permease, partial [Woeseia sp.]
MRALRVVFGKEVMDNFRDRRTLMSALLMGPLFGPILFAFVINLSLKQSLSDDAEPLDLPVIGQEHAPNLMTFLESENINVVTGPADRDAAIAAVKDGTHDVVVFIPAEFGEQLAAGTPALLEVISDQADTTAEREARRA